MENSATCHLFLGLGVGGDVAVAEELKHETERTEQAQRFL